MAKRKNSASRRAGRGDRGRGGERPSSEALRAFIRSRGAYLLAQRSLLDDLEALDLDPFRLFQLGLDDLGRMIDVQFRDLRDHDTMAPEVEAGIETIGGNGVAVREITSRDELVR